MILEFSGWRLGQGGQPDTIASASEGRHQSKVARCHGLLESTLGDSGGPWALPRLGSGCRRVSIMTFFGPTKRPTD
jgi:hypothetical protein